MWKLTWRLYRESCHRWGRERQAPSGSTGVVTTARTQRELGQHGRPHRAVERKTNRRPVKARPGAAGRVGWAHSVRWTACRYADDGLVHCRNEQEAQALKAELQARLAECRLEMHPTKTKIVYCKGGKRKGTYPNIQFDFLGYCFRPRLVRRSRDNTLFWGFNPAVSASALKAMRATIRELNLRHRTSRLRQTRKSGSMRGVWKQGPWQGC
jgi:hypothetical protein